MAESLILVVCTANVCRSRYAELLLRQGLADRTDIVCASAGTQALEGYEICRQVAARRTDSGDSLVGGSRKLTQDLVEEALLVLTASKDVRAEVVRLSPAARDRTFTLVEAAHRGTRFGLDGTQGRGTLADYLEHLDRARAELGSPAMPKRRWGRRSDHDALSIEDRHGSRDCAHNKMLDEIEAPVRAIVEQLSRVRPKV